MYFEKGKDPTGDATSFELHTNFFLFSSDGLYYVLLQKSGCPSFKKVE